MVRNLRYSPTYQNKALTMITLDSLTPQTSNPKNLFNLTSFN